jgi:hypothetical protein
MKYWKITALSKYGVKAGGMPMPKEGCGELRANNSINN